jgi:hypothetical protein
VLTSSIGLFIGPLGVRTTTASICNCNFMIRTGKSRTGDEPGNRRAMLWLAVTLLLQLIMKSDTIMVSLNSTLAAVLAC